MARHAAVLALLLTAATLNAATYTVTNTADSGAGSFRQAILDANANAGADTIAFAIGTGAQTITLASDPPDVTDPVTIDGTTQPGYAGTPLVKIQSHDPAAAVFNIVAGNSTLRGLHFLGLQLDLETAGNNTVAGNVISSAAGRDALGRCGIRVTSNGNTIGGTTAADRNVIVFNNEGACISGSNNVFKGNYAGMGADGISTSGNRFSGVSVGGSGNQIGGTEAGARNVISGNRETGISIGGTQNVVKGNYIGVAADGVTPSGNGLLGLQYDANGVSVYGTGHVIGGLEPGAANIIAHHPHNGVSLKDTSVAGVAILSNSIYGNFRKGINLTVPEVTTPLPNDALDADSGANGLQNYPQICSVIQSGQNVVITGRLHSTPNTQFTIQFFSNGGAEATCQAQTFLGTTTATTNGSGDVAFTATIPGTATSLVSATATDPSNNTSELSPCTRCSAASDFNGDGRSDIFWRNTSTGENTLWLMNVRTVIGGGNIPSAPPEWNPYLGDFNGDAKTDIFWHNSTTGQTGLWYMNGTTLLGGGGNTPSMAPEWVPLPGDFTGDGKWDLLWRNTNTGDQLMWGSRTPFPAFNILGSTPGSAPGTGWQRRAGSLNGDSMADVYWRDQTNGPNSLWFMNARSVIGGANLPPIPSDWTPSFGDSNGDGRSDILWRNSNTGELTFWFLSGGSIIAGGNIPPVGTPWLLARGDFDGNGRLDILWRSPVDGENTMWLLDGRTIIGGGNIGTVPGTEWVIIGQH